MCVVESGSRSMIDAELEGFEDRTQQPGPGAGSIGSIGITALSDGGNESSKKLKVEGLVRTASGGVAATILAIPPGGHPGEEEQGGGAVAAGSGSSLGNAPELPHSVMQMVATSLQCDLLVAALVQKPFNLAETVLCVPKGLVTVPVRLTPGVMRAAAGPGCKAVSTEGVRLPSLLSTVLGDRPTRLMATQFQAEGHQGICYALWLDPGRVLPDCENVMGEAGQSLPLLLAAKVRASCWDRLGRRFDVILKAMPHSVVFVDDGTGPCLVNSAASALLALDGAGEVDARVVAAGMCRLANRCVVRAHAYRCFRQVAANRDQLFQWDWELKEPRRVYRVRSYPVSKNATHGRIWFLDDITPEWDARLAVEAADKAKTQFLAMMSHELRTPMTGVLGMLDLLQHDTSLSSEQARFVRVMQGCGQGLMQVLDEILDFSAIQSGKFTLEVKSFHIGELMEQLSALFQGRLAEKHLSLALVMPECHQQAVRGDERIRQVLNNLVSNAIKFTETGGIHISWLPVQDAAGDQDERPPMLTATTDRRPANLNNLDAGGEEDAGTAVWHEVRVRDSGIGLSKEQQGRLFQSFSQADTSTTRKFGGTGLGLAISKGLVTAMGGRIWVESEPGRGSTFAFRIPLLPTPGSPQMRPQPSSSVHKVDSLKRTARSLRVLAAEDDRVSRALLGRMLHIYGHEVHLVGNGQLAVEAIREGQYDMVLMDLQMPVLDGLSATRAIRSLDGPASQVPIYALTADVLTKERETLEAMKLDGYLTKPINWDSLSAVIDTVVASTSSGRVPITAYPVTDQLVEQ